MHLPTSTTEITAAYIREKSGTRRDQWAVHTVTVIDPGTAEGLRGGMEIEISGESAAYEFSDDLEGKEIDPNEVFRVGCEYRLIGTLHEGKLYRGVKTPVFKFKTFVRCTPASKQAILRYLQECPHVGPKVAIALWEKFGADAVKALRENPAGVAAKTFISGNRRALTPEYAELAAVHLRKLHALESTTMELMDLLAGYGLPKSTAKRAIHRWGNRAAETIRRNPLGTLMSFRGCGFAKADKVYQAQGLPLDAPKRLTLCAWHFLNSDANGHTWFDYSKVANHLRLNVGGVANITLTPQAGAKRRPTAERERKESPADWAIRGGVRCGLLAEYVDDHGRRWLAEGTKAREEKRLADIVLAKMDEANPWQEMLDSPLLAECLADLSDHQRKKLLSILGRGAIIMLGGGPGTGKTYTVAGLIKLAIAVKGESAIAGTAFTGNATQRLAQGLAKYQIKIQTRTTHSLLKVTNFSDDSDDDEPSQFEFNARNPLAFTIINADEFSMNGVGLALALIEAVAKGGGILIVGDVKQLPPIEHGAPLRDFIAAGIPYAELTDTWRNAGQVVQIGKKLREGKPIGQHDFSKLKTLQIDGDDPRNCAYVAARTSEETNAQVIRTIKHLRDVHGFNPIWDVQVIVATNKKRVELNAVLQREFNATAVVVPNTRFRVGDKAIQLKNMAYQLAAGADEDYRPIPDSSARVANGEFAKIVDIQEKRIVAEFSMPDRRVSIARVKEPEKGLREEGKQGAAGDDAKEEKAPALAFDLGLAVTCHKMQGSQAKAVVVVLESAYGQACEWFLTALSRMEKACVVVGDFDIARKMAGRRSLGDRKTFLVELIEGGRVFAERAWWVNEEQRQEEGAVTV